jgi:hypothetical protein
MKHFMEGWKWIKGVSGTEAPEKRATREERSRVVHQLKKES